MDKAQKIDIEIKKMHNDIKKSSLILRERLHDICEDMLEWKSIGDTDEERNDNGWF